MKSTMEVGAHMNIQVKKINKAMAKVSSVSSWYTSSALTAALTQRWLQVIVFLYAAFNFYVFVDNLRGLHRIGYAEARLFRFVPLQLRGGGTPAPPGVDAWGLLLDGCKVPESAYNVTVDGTGVMLNFTKPQAMNGWWIRTLAGTPEADAVQFNVEAWDDKQAWRRVGSSRPIQDPLKALLVVAPWKPVPEKRLQEQVYDRRVSWQNQIFMYGDCIFSMFGCTFTTFFAIYGYEHRAKMCGAIVLILSGSSGLVSATAYVATGRALESLDAWLRSSVAVVCGLTLAHGESHIVVGMFLYGVWLLLLPWIQASVYSGTPAAAPNKIPFAGIIITPIAISIWMLRKYVLWKARRKLQADIDAYNRAWMAILRRSDTPAALTGLAALCAQVQERSVRPKDQPPRQYNRLIAKVAGDQDGVASMGFGWLRLTSSSARVTPAEASSHGSVEDVVHDKVQSGARNVLRAVSGGGSPQCERLGLDYSSPIMSLDQVCVCVCVCVCVLYLLGDSRSFVSVCVYSAL
jgi:hypothetical protein